MARVANDLEFRAVIRHRDNGHYYAGDGKWVVEQSDAMEFYSIDEVMSEAAAQGLKNCCDIVVQLEGDSRFRIFLPL